MASTIAIIGFALGPKMRPCFLRGAGMASDTTGLNPCQPDSKVKHKKWSLFEEVVSIETYLTLLYCMCVNILHLEESIKGDIDFYRELRTADC